MPEDPVELARRYRAQQIELADVLSRLERLIGTHASGAEACADLGREAWENYEHEKQYDPYDRSRDAAKLRRLMELAETDHALWVTNPRTVELERALREVEEERRALSEELGVDAPIGHPGFQNMLRIADAVEAGAAACPDGKPEDWPNDVPWLRPKLWDPDQYLKRAAERHLRQAVDMLLASEAAKLRLGWSILLAATRDRALTEEVLRAAGVENIDLGGATRGYLDWLKPAGASPVRVLLADARCWSDEFDQSDVRQRFNLSGGEPGTPGLRNADDLAGTLTTLEYANLDARLLPIARELVEGLATGSAEPEPERPDMSGWVEKKRRAFIACWDSPHGAWVTEGKAMEWRVPQRSFREWGEKLLQGKSLDCRHSQGQPYQIRRERLLKLLEEWRARA